MVSNSQVEEAVDFAAASIFAGALGFAAAALAGALAAAAVAPAGFASAYWVLALVDRRPHELKAFDIAPITPPRQERASNENENVVPLFSQPVLAIAHSRAATADGASADRASVDGASVGGAGQDAAQALSDALAALKQSLR